MTAPLIQNRDLLENRLKELPAEPGVYLMRDATDQILYVGKSKKLRSRVRSYFRFTSDLSPRIQRMVMQVCEIEFIVTDNESEALALEDNLIKTHQPPYNVLLKDDKKYPYLCITWSNTYPHLYITRHRRLNQNQDKYYGPYTDVGLLRYTLGLVKRIFPLRQRPKPLYKDRTCLNYDIGRCPGVCQGLISPEDYRKTLSQVAMIFQGQTDELVKELHQKMIQAAEQENYEAAARFRDQIRGLEQLGESQKVSLPNSTVSRDALALAMNDSRACIQLFQVRVGKLVGRLGFIAENQGDDPALILQRVLQEHYQHCDPVEIPSEILTQYELPEQDFLEAWLSQKKGRKVSLVAPQRQSKAELIELVERNAELELTRTQRLADRDAAALERLAEVLDLPEAPRRLEAYDISHIQGSDAVGSQVVFIDGLPAKQYYRRYKIRNPEVRPGRSDDFASHAEVARRRFGKMTPQDQPDLVLIDGGKGQLSAVLAVLADLGLDHLPVIGLAKREEEIFLPGDPTPIRLDPQDPARLLLQRLRDEAHRFAITFHHQQRKVRQQASTLDEIPGLGKHRQKLLLEEFRSIARIQMASVEQLAQVPGIGPKLARQIYLYFHPDSQAESLETVQVG
ncbi:excinuclease ABC subunit UvrC [Thermostichus vulcanus]|uniref:UvrABC system protein C n=1 Tax=Thermostichus vulcanus str. 'Rupite' TaxID=2813851 RepID=A0ABT0C816_THEVL|nr:excinuclease ABC subunit UvrC [Thermostichus vulcanus]MCJ2541844.1 excinuclease ABC subunit UvrC [Thermostichus vulcanus str. 'Rupite']